MASRIVLDGACPLRGKARSRPHALNRSDARLLGLRGGALTWTNVCGVDFGAARDVRLTEEAMQLDEIVENFELLDDWDDRYRYLIELGRVLEPLDDAARNDANKVRGCASQVWLETRLSREGDAPRLLLKGDSDAHIVRGLITLVFALYSGKTAPEILETEAQPLFERLGLSAHLTPQRSNGVRAMVERIKSDARAAT